MRHPNDKRPSTKAQDRARWNAFLIAWQRIGVAAYVLAMAPSEMERWIAVWSFDDRGRRVTHPGRHDLMPWDMIRDAEARRYADRNAVTGSSRDSIAAAWSAGWDARERAGRLSPTRRSRTGPRCTCVHVHQNTPEITDAADERHLAPRWRAVRHHNTACPVHGAIDRWLELGIPT